MTGYCGHCHKETTWRKGTGTAWTLWLCNICGYMTGHINKEPQQ